jgi:hypothetical protein
LVILILFIRAAAGIRAGEAAFTPHGPAFAGSPKSRWKVYRYTIRTSRVFQGASGLTYAVLKASCTCLLLFNYLRILKSLKVDDIIF